ncbi:MAG: hypothetical protein HQ522_16330 [Bacteroidetes bacterium]|nr:hypothetical protein [Bacteroidota bacterium]
MAFKLIINAVHSAQKIKSMKKILFLVSLLVITLGAFCLNADRPPENTVAVEVAQAIILPMDYQMPIVYISSFVIQERPQGTIEVTAEKRKQAAGDFKYSAEYQKKAGTYCYEQNGKNSNYSKGIQVVRIRGSDSCGLM